MTVQDLNQQGEDFLEAGKLQEAETSFLQAIQTDPEYHPTYGNMLEVMTQKKDYAKALEWGILSLQADPENDNYKERIINVFRNSKIVLFNDHLVWAFKECLKIKNAEFAGLQPQWLGRIKQDTNFKKLYKTAAKQNYQKFCKELEKIKNLQLFGTEFFQLGLQKLLICNYDFEIILTYLRRWLLESETQSLPGMTKENFEEFLMSLALYCFRTEYVFYEEDSEKEKLHALKNKIETKPDNATEIDLMLYSCYRRFHTLQNAKKLAKDITRKEKYAYFLDTQNNNFLKETQIKKDIKSLTPIKNETSDKVREQYDEFPYPRWQSISLNNSSEAHIAFLGKEKASHLSEKGTKILIAGCGTGRQACEYAQAFSNAEVTAIDLSKANLAYAINKTKEYSLKNIQYFQADISELPTDLGSFDFIVCTGVLHHMADPEKGLESITNLLKPGGFMRIALYSATARTFVQKGRNIIRENNIPSTDDGVRFFRKNAEKFLGKNDSKITFGAADFYTTAECIDLFFHAHEDCYTIPRIKDNLSKFGLSFIGFEHRTAHRENYLKKFKNDPEMKNLDNWHIYEQKNPQIFLDMYRFFVEKPI